VAEKGVRPGVGLAVAAVLLALAAVVVVLERTRSSAPEPTEETASADASATATVSDPNESPARPAPPANRPAPEPPAYIENLVWGDIDLREARAVMPDNLYWELGAPTNDPAVLEAREAEKKRRNEEYGRVLAGDANEAEVNAYYDYRERLSTDYLEFSEWMKNRYGDGLAEQFRGLLDLSIKLHTARLAQIATDRADALERSVARAKIREDWKRQQKEFGEFR
jgi:hypothetical protein